MCYKFLQCKKVDKNTSLNQFKKKNRSLKKNGSFFTFLK